MDSSYLPYDFSKVDVYIELDEELNEISGLHYINENLLAAVEDEHGKIYLLDTKEGEVIDEIKFKKKGDFEGVAYFNDTFYALESNGSIYAVSNNGKKTVFKFKNNKDFDFEGLCVDHINNQLLIACKDHGKNKKNNNIYIYSFSLLEREYRKEAYLELDKSDIHKNFGASGIAFHPNGDLYILSSRSKSLLVLPKEGNYKIINSLSEYTFHQPEGITFAENGDLYISNEQNNGGPTILKFNMVP